MLSYAIPVDKKISRQFTHIERLVMNPFVTSHVVDATGQVVFEVSQIQAVPAELSFLRVGQVQTPVSVAVFQENKKVELQTQANVFPTTVNPVLY